MIYKAIPITQKSKASPLKANKALIEGAGIAADKFDDFGASEVDKETNKEIPTTLEIPNRGAELKNVL